MTINPPYSLPTEPLEREKWHHRTGRVNFAIFETVANHPFRIILITHERGEYAIQRKKRTH
jgi:hypothetical protein